jgi:CDP-glucose 4,6-dehydratase
LSGFDLKQISKIQGPILITGHTGFKGAWMSLLLKKLGVPVIGYSLTPERDSLYDRAKLAGAIPEIFADIRDIDLFRKFISEHKPSCIFHMAAQPLVLKSYESPRETFETNVMGTVNVLDVAFEIDFVKAVVVITTDKVYRNNGLSQSFVESDPLEGKDPYSASKVGAESAVAAWQQIQKISGGPKVISVRAGNVIGGGDWASDRLLPDLIRSLTHKQNLNPRNPQSTRPWQHVLDPLRGYIMALEAVLAGKNFPALNFGPSGKSLAVEEILRIGADEWDGRITAPRNHPTNDPSIKLEASTLELDSTLSSTQLGWVPLWSQEEAVRSTISWWKNYLSDSSFSFDDMNGDFERILP